MAVQAYRNDLIKGAMAAQGISKESLKELTGLSADTLRRIRAGEPNVGVNNLMLVAEALGLTMEQLFKLEAENAATM